MNTDLSIPCTSSDLKSLERTRFFARQLVTPDDLTQDQVYFREKLRRHNRLLHGWGVVCGARVRGVPGTCEVVVEPGYLLGPFGDEIYIDREVTVDLCREDLDGNAVSSCGALEDPWCSDVRVDRRAGQTLYVAVRYAECRSRPVRVQTNGCGCDETECAYSRIRDSYAVKALTRLPDTYFDPMPEPDSENLLRCPPSDEVCLGRPCPPCPTEPWVVLADVTLGQDGNVETIDCFAHRRYVVSFADFYFLCRNDGQDEPDIAVAPAALNFGQVTVGESASATLAVSNEGSIDLSVEVTTLAGQNANEFEITSGAAPFTLPPGGQQNVTVSFNPTSAGAKSASLKISSDDPDENPVNTSLTGNATAQGVPNIEVNPNELDFGFTTPLLPLTVVNNGTAQLEVSSTTLTGAQAGSFSIENGGAFALAPGVSRILNVRFRPVGGGVESHTASLRIESNDPDQPAVDVPLSGSVLL